jgi:hypothetical protein
MSEEMKILIRIIVRCLKYSAAELTKLLGERREKKG